MYVLLFAFALCSNVVAWVEVSSAYTVIRLVSPLFVSVSLTLCTPLSFLLDAFVNHDPPSVGKIIAVCVILVGYLILLASYAGYEIGPTWTPLPGGLCKVKSGAGTIEEIEMDEEAIGLLDSRENRFEKHYGAGNIR
jgi:hypothetical protein